MKYAKKSKLKAKIIESSPKKILLSAQGKNIHSYFWRESGKHRVQRIPPTENGGRVHTSIVNVIVLDGNSKPNKIKLDKNKIKTSYYKDSGAGGQHRNKTMSGTRLQYDDIIVTCCDTRDQRKNKEIAFEKLKQILEQKQNNKILSQISENINSQNPDRGKRGDFVRNYNFPRDEIKQGNNKSSLSKFLKGDFSQIYKKSC